MLEVPRRDDERIGARSSPIRQERRRESRRRSPGSASTHSPALQAGRRSTISATIRPTGRNASVNDMPKAMTIPEPTASSEPSEDRPCGGCGAPERPRPRVPVRSSRAMDRRCRRPAETGWRPGPAARAPRRPRTSGPAARLAPASRAARPCRRRRAASRGPWRRARPGRPRQAARALGLAKTRKPASTEGGM